MLLIRFKSFLMALITTTFGHNPCVASLRAVNFGYMSLEMWSSQSKTQMNLKILLNLDLRIGIVTITRSSLGFAIHPFHLLACCLEVLILPRQPGTSLLYTTHANLVLILFESISSSLNYIILNNNQGNLLMICFSACNISGINYPYMIQHGIVHAMPKNFVNIRIDFDSFNF